MRDPVAAAMVKRAEYVFAEKDAEIKRLKKLLEGREA
jgi:hypothetical protein